MNIPKGNIRTPEELGIAHIGSPHTAIVPPMQAIDRAVNERLHINDKPETRKRYIDGYVERAGIQFGGKSIVLAENAQNPGSYLICNITRDNPLGMEERGDIIRTEDYIHAMREFAKRIDTTAATLSADRIAADIPHKPLTSDDCVPDSQHADWEGKLIIIKPETLAPEYRVAEHQLCYCIGGFGSKAEARGNKVYVKELLSGDKCYYQRYNVAGVADTAKIPQWAADKFTEQNKRKSKSKTISPGTAKTSVGQSRLSQQRPPTKKPTLQDKMESAKQKVAIQDAALKGDRR